MQHRINRFFDGIAQYLGGNVDFIGVILGPFPDFGCGAVAVGAGLALYRDDGRGQLIAEKILVQTVVDML